jgi:hypothetical protein
MRHEGTPVVSVEGRRLASNGDGAPRGWSAAARGMRQKQRLWLWPARCLLRACDPRAAHTPEFDWRVNRQSPDPPVHVLDLKSGSDRRLGTLEGLAWRPLGLAVSADGRTILYPRQVHINADLMLIENFR